jgi:hypothetical protein
MHEGGAVCANGLREEQILFNWNEIRVVEG